MSRREALIESARKVAKDAWKAPIKPFGGDTRGQVNLGGMLGGGVSEIADVIGKSKESAARNSFSRELGVGDFDGFGGDFTPGKFTELASLRIPADTEWSWGYGSANNPENQGYLYVDLQSSTPNPVEGIIRFVVVSSTGRKTQVVADYDTERLGASKTDRTKQVPFPEQVSSALASEDAYLRVLLNPSPDNTDQSVAAAQSEVIIPATEYDLS